MDPFYEHCKRMAMGGGFKPGDSDEIGQVYKSILHQQGFGFSPEMYDYDETYGLGLGQMFSKLFRAAAPAVKSGLKYLGKTAVGTVADIAKDALNGDDLKESATRHVQNALGDVFAKAPELLRANTAGQWNKSGSRKRQAVSHPSRGKLVASARRGNKRRRQAQSYDLDEYPGLHRLL